MGSIRGILLDYDYATTRSEHQGIYGWKRDYCAAGAKLCIFMSRKCQNLFVFLRVLASGKTCAGVANLYCHPCRVRRGGREAFAPAAPSPWIRQCPNFISCTDTFITMSGRKRMKSAVSRLATRPWRSILHTFWKADVYKRTHSNFMRSSKGYVHLTKFDNPISLIKRPAWLVARTTWLSMGKQCLHANLTTADSDYDATAKLMLQK